MRDNPPKRTRATDLDDDVLLLLDYVFDSWSSIEGMQREAFPIHDNVSYTHRFDERELARQVRRLVDDRVLQEAIDDHSGREVFTLSPDRGRLWELERTPDWARFLADSSWQEGDGGWVLEVRAATESIAEHFLQLSARSGLWGHQVGPVQRAQRPDDWTLIAWRAFRKTTTLTVEIIPSESRTDWTLFEAERQCWRSVHELQKFQP